MENYEHIMLRAAFFLETLYVVVCSMGRVIVFHINMIKIDCLKPRQK